MSDISSDVLSSASLILAALTTIYGLYYSDIRDILDVVPKTGDLKPDNKPNYTKAKTILRSKLIPLLVGSIVLTLVFIPDFIYQLVNCYQIWRDLGVSYDTYNTSNAAYVVVTFFAIMLTGSVLLMFYGFVKKIRALRS